MSINATRFGPISQSR